MKFFDTIMLFETQSMLGILFWSNLFMAAMIFAFQSVTKISHNMENIKKAVITRLGFSAACLLLMMRFISPYILSYNIGYSLLFCCFYMDANLMLSFLSDTKISQHKIALRAILAAGIIFFNLSDIVFHQEIFSSIFSSVIILAIYGIVTVSYFREKNNTRFKRVIGAFYVLFLISIFPRIIIPLTGFNAWDFVHGINPILEKYSITTQMVYANSGFYLVLLIISACGTLAVLLFIKEKDEAILENAIKEAEEANNAKSDFLAKMSHEIRTPMNVITGICEILRQDDSLPQKTAESITRISNSSDLLLGLINDILDISKIEAGKLELITDNYEIDDLINDIVQLNIARFENKPVKFSVNIDPDIPQAMTGDVLRIKQIMNNIISNAAKYTRQGEVVLAVKTENLNNRENEDFNVKLIFTVRDTGIGMSEDELAKLFDEYSRFNEKENRYTQGTGLGMSITRNLLQLMNGEINVESRPQKGSCFTVIIPQKKTTDKALGREKAESLQLLKSGAASKKHRIVSYEPMPYGSILVVDDNESNLFVAKGLFSPYGLGIDTAMSGFEAIDKIKAGKKYDIIFMDHYMHKMDGVETVKIIRGMGYAHTIIALTADAVAGRQEFFLENGFDGFLSKPIDINLADSLLKNFIRDKYPERVIESAQSDGALRGETPAENANSMLLESAARDIRKALGILNDFNDEKDFCNEEALRKYTVTVHGIKSSLANIGEKPLSMTANDLETAARQKDFGILISRSQAFKTQLYSLLERLETPQVKNKEEDSPAALECKLLAVKKLCEDFDRKGALEALSDIKSGSEDINKTINIIRENILHSDFEEAAKIAEVCLNKLQE